MDRVYKFRKLGYVFMEYGLFVSFSSLLGIRYISPFLYVYGFGEIPSYIISFISVSMFTSLLAYKSRMKRQHVVVPNHEKHIAIANAIGLSPAFAVIGLATYIPLKIITLSTQATHKIRTVINQMRL